MGIIIKSGNNQLLHIADVIHHPLQVTNPDWCVSIDSNKQLARQTRRMVWQGAADENMLVFSAHVDGSGRGFITEDDGIWKWQAVET